MKKKTLRYKEQDAIKVEDYKNTIKDIPNSKIVYVDETGIIESTVMQRNERNK